VRIKLVEQTGEVINGIDCADATTFFEFAGESDVNPFI
jgi:hypothetical protein